MKNTRIFPHFPQNLHSFAEALGLALPIMAQSAVTVAVQLTDSLMLSWYGEQALSASSLAGQYLALVQLCAMGVGVGTGVLTARFWGMQERESLHRSVTLLCRGELLLAAGFGLVGTVWPETVLGLFTADARLIEAGRDYLRWLWPGYLPLALSQGCTAVLRSVGEVRRPLWYSLAGFAVNAVLNGLLIFGLFGLPELGVKGAAAATAAARWTEGLLCCGHFFFREQGIGYRVKHLGLPCRGELRQYMRICLPVLLSDGLLGLGNTASAAIFGHLGPAYVAGSAVTMVLQQLSGVLHHGVAGAAGVVIGHTLGEGDKEDAQRQGWGFALLGAAVGLAATGLVAVLQRPLLQLYRVSPEAEAVAREIFRGMLLTMTVRCTSGALTKGVLRAGGDTAFVMAADLGFLWLVSIPAASVWALCLHGSALGTYVLLQTDQILKCGLCLWRLHSEKWMKRIFGCA